VPRAPDLTGLFEAVHQAGHRTGRQPGPVGELARRHRPVPPDDPERLVVGRRESRQRAQRLVEHHDGIAELAAEPRARVRGR